MNPYKHRGTNPIFALSIAACLVFLLPTLPAYAADNVVRFKPSFAVTNIVALANDRLLLWAEDGQIQIWDINGKENAVTRLPNRRIMDVKRDGTGFLLFDEAIETSGTSTILAFDANSKETDRWQVNAAWELVVTEAGRWATIFKGGMVALKPGGLLGKAEDIPEWRGQPARPRRLSNIPLRWHRYDSQGITVYCHDADLSKAGAAESRCERPGTVGWAHTGSWVMAPPPILCGPWLVLPDGKKGEQLAVLDIKTGQIVGRKNLEPSHKVCTADNNLLVSTNRLVLLQLPSLKSEWQSPKQRLHIASLEATEHYFVYRMATSHEIFAIRR